MSKKSLTISDNTTGPYECVGWKSDRTGIFVLDKEGERRFVELIRPTIQGIDCYKQPFDLSHPTNIEAIRLVPPPCRSSKMEAEALLRCTKNIEWGKIKTVEDAQAHYSTYAINMGCKTAQLPELWEMIYGSCLYPDKKDADALKPIVSDHYKKQGAECRHRLLQLKETTKKEIQTLGKDKAHDYNWSERKAKRKNISDLYSRFLDDPNKRNQREWKIPVDIAINENVGGLVERYLIDSWANRNGWSLDEIADHRQRYHNSLQTDIINLVYRNVFLETFEASVRYIIKLQSGAAYYLETVFIRDLADKGEFDEFSLLTCKGKNSSKEMEIIDAMVSGLKPILMQLKLLKPHYMSLPKHEAIIKRIAEESEEKNKSLQNALLGKITVAQVHRGVSNEKLNELVKVEAIKVIAELGWGDGNNTVKGRRMDCMRKPYKERVKIIALVLRHLSGIGQPTKKLAKKAEVSVSTFKRLTKLVRETKVAKGLTQQFSQIARDSLDISVGNPD
jgi:hypothetical protein